MGPCFFALILKKLFICNRLQLIDTKMKKEKKKSPVGGCFPVRKMLGILALCFFTCLSAQISVSKGATLYIGSETDIITVQVSDSGTEKLPEKILYSQGGKILISGNQSKSYKIVHLSESQMAQKKAVSGKTTLALAKKKTPSQNIRKTIVTQKVRTTLKQDDAEVFMMKAVQRVASSVPAPSTVHKDPLIQPSLFRIDVPSHEAHEMPSMREPIRPLSKRFFISFAMRPPPSC